MGSLYLWGRSIQEMGGDVVIGRSIYGVVVIGASLSEPHTSESNGRFFIYYFIYISAVRTLFHKCKLNFFNPKHCSRQSVWAEYRKEHVVKE